MTSYVLETGCHRNDHIALTIFLARFRIYHYANGQLLLLAFNLDGNSSQKIEANMTVELLAQWTAEQGDRHFVLFR